jgi:hypothetical protein
VSLARQLVLGVLAAIGVGAIASGCLTWAWVGENLSGDFANQETGAIDYGFTATVFATWTALFATPLAVIASLVVLAFERGKGGG